MHLDLDVGGVDEHCLQVLDVLFDAVRVVAIGPGHYDVLRMALAEAAPLLIAENVEVERVKDLQAILDCRRLFLVRGRGR